jgi:lysophospholipase L1-like esterase
MALAIDVNGNRVNPARARQMAVRRRAVEPNSVATTLGPSERAAIDFRENGATYPMLSGFYGLALLAQAGQAMMTPDPALNALDCPSIRVDFGSILPELIEPRPFTAPNPPFSEAGLKQLRRSAALDPNGLCQYRDANRALLPATKHRVIFLGDSITENWAIAEKSLFVDDVLGRGISAQTTTQMLARFQQDVIDLKPRKVHIIAGINDAMSTGGAVGARANIVSMVELARAHGITVILGTLTPADTFWLAPGVELAPFVAEHNRWLRSYAAREGIALVDYHAALAGPDGQILPGVSNDGLHPNRLGYARMSSLARRALK